MRFILWLGFLLCCVATGYIGSGFLGELRERTDVRKTEQMAQRDRVMGVLKAQERYRFYQVVIGPGEVPGEIGFRGRVSDQGSSSQSVYGIVHATCDLSTEGPGCWELASLVIDGVPTEAIVPAPGAPEPVLSEAPQPTPTPGTEPVSGTQPAPAPAPAPDSTAETIAETAPEPPAPDLAPDPAPDPAAGPSFRPSHTVRLSLVNARNAPGGAVETQLAGGTLLILLETQGGWGRFQVLDGPDTGREVWVAFSVLEAV